MDKPMRCLNLVQVCLVLCCLACGQSEARRVQLYLHDTDRSMQELCQLGKDFEAMGEELRRQVGNDYSRAHVAAVAGGLEPRLEAMAIRLAALVDHLRAIEPPPGARDYHARLMELLEPFEKGVSAYTELGRQMKTGQGFSVTTFAGLMGEMVRAVETCQSASRRVQEERQKLLDEYSIPVGEDGLVP